MKIDNEPEEIHVFIDAWTVVAAAMILAILAMWWWQLALGVLIVCAVAVLAYNGLGGKTYLDMTDD